MFFTYYSEKLTIDFASSLEHNDSSLVCLSSLDSAEVSK